MTSKTFESIDQTRQLHVKPLDKHVTLVINYKDAGRSGLTISHSDAPALALAVLEAAGCDWDRGRITNLGQAFSWLDKEVKQQERAATEAKEHAELEAEALGLAKAGCEAVGDESAQNLSDMTDKDQRFFLAVARRAREMSNEKKVNTND